MEDCAFGRDGLTVTLRKSKTDQDGASRKIGIAYGSNPATCPVRTLEAWLELAAIASDPLFCSLNRHGQVQPGRLSPIDVARVVKKLAERAGLDAANYAGHSLRAGHATSAAIAGASERSIMRQTGHKSVQMLRRYIRDGHGPLTVAAHRLAADEDADGQAPNPSAYSCRRATAAVR